MVPRGMENQLYHGVIAARSGRHPYRFKVVGQDGGFVRLAARNPAYMGVPIQQGRGSDSMKEY